MSALPKVEPHPPPVRIALIVDPEADIEDLLRRVLDPRSWAIQHVTNNEAALGLVQKQSFDLILTSQRTSGKDDIELLRKIRRVRPHTRLIVLTDESTPADVIESMRRSSTVGSLIQHRELRSGMSALVIW